MRAGRQADTADFHAVDAGHAIVLGQPLVEHREVGVDERRDRQIPGDQLAEKRPRFRHHAVVKRHAILWIELPVGNRLVHPPKFEPLVGEVDDESFTSRVGEQTVDLLADDSRIGERAGGRRGEERLVGGRVPEPVGEP